MLIVDRIKMNIAVRKIEKYMISNKCDSVLHDDMDSFTSTQSKLNTLKKLNSMGVIKLVYFYESHIPTCIHKTDNLFLYRMERSELWLNRIISYVLGVLTPIAIYLITNHFFPTTP